jgi:hypothetical protein
MEMKMKMDMDMDMLMEMERAETYNDLDIRYRENYNQYPTYTDQCCLLQCDYHSSLITESVPTLL